jgi:predicted N-formylglutamate amidohydrolase
VLQRYYWPYRQWVETQIAAAVKSSEKAIHVSSHSFTPSLHGEVRRADIGLLYDPSRRSERDLCLEWQRAIRDADRTLVVRRNYPYRGNADGLTTHLRRLHADGRYAGVEIEVNQKHTRGDGEAWRALRKIIVESLRTTLGNVS